MYCSHNCSFLTSIFSDNRLRTNITSRFIFARVMECHGYVGCVMCPNICSDGYDVRKFESDARFFAKSISVLFNRTF